MQGSKWCVGEGTRRAEGYSRHCCERDGWGRREGFGVGRGQSTKDLQSGWVPVPAVAVCEILARAE